MGHGLMAEWLRSGLQIRARRFDSGSGLHRELHDRSDGRGHPADDGGGADRCGHDGDRHGGARVAADEEQNAVEHDLLPPDTDKAPQFPAFIKVYEGLIAHW